MSAGHRPPNCDDEFLTIAEVASTLRLSQQTIHHRAPAPAGVRAPGISADAS